MGKADNGMREGVGKKGRTQAEGKDVGERDKKKKKTRNKQNGERKIK